LSYGLILFFISGVPSLLGMFLLINLPVKFFIAGTVSALVNSLIGGIIIAWSVEKSGVCGLISPHSVLYGPGWGISQIEGLLPSQS